MRNLSPTFSGIRDRLLRLTPAPLRRVVRRFQNDDRGVYAIEFAFVSVPFFALLFAIIETAFGFWVGQVLDAGMASAARQVLTGQSQNNVAITDLATFMSKAVCPNMPSIIDCSQVKVDVRSAASFATVPAWNAQADGTYDTSAFTYQKTNPGDVVVVRAVYYFPVYTSFLGAPGTVSINGHSRVLISVTTFRNEPF